MLRGDVVQRDQGWNDEEGQGGRFDMKKSKVICKVCGGRMRDCRRGERERESWKKGIIRWRGERELW